MKTKINVYSQFKLTNVTYVEQKKCGLSMSDMHGRYTKYGQMFLSDTEVNA